jgi:hypothetical protein
MPAVPKAKAFRSEEKLKWVSGFPCAMVLESNRGSCGSVPGFTKMQAVHVKARARYGDRWVLPGCPRHHNEQHQIGVKSFERRWGAPLKRIANFFHEWWLLKELCDAPRR